MDKNEIICISSDDEDDTEAIRKNASNTKVSDISKSNGSSDAKVENAADVKVESYRQKRKILEVDTDSCEFVKIMKIEVNKKGSNSEISNAESVDESVNNQEAKQEKKIVKPELIIKERKTCSPMAQDIFSMFISLCLQKERSREMQTIVNKLKRRYEQLDSEYVRSNAFSKFLNEKRNDIVNSTYGVYQHIREVMNEMKNQILKRSTLLNNKKFASNVKRNNGEVGESSSACVDNVIEVDETNESDDEDQERNDALKKKIDKIIHAIEKCKKYIKMYEEKEINFEDENNSDYIKCERYKQRAVELYNKYCELTGENADAGRHYLRPKHFSTTGIVAVDHAITSFINSNISKRNKSKTGSFVDAIIFPDCSDIYECIRVCNDSHNLGLDNNKIKQLAKKAFTELGENLQRSRRNDYWDTFSLFLDNEEEDPAVRDSELAKKLTENKKEGDKRLASVFDKYVQKQEALKNEPGEGDDTSSGENGEDEEDNEEDVDEITDDDVCLSSEEDKENNADEGDSSKSKTDTNIKSTEKIETIVIDEEKKCETDTNDRLKSNDEKCVNGNASIPESKTNSTLKLIEERKEKQIPDVSSDATASVEVIEIPKVDKDSSGEGKEDVTNGVSEETTDIKKTEAEEKPLLRVRSFAATPTTWEDTQRASVSRESSATESSTNKGVINLTSNGSMNIKIGSKIIPLVNGKNRTLVIQSGTNNTINVQNITNNYVKLDPRSANTSNLSKSQNKFILLPVQSAGSVSKGSTITRLPANMSVNRQANANNQTNSLPLKQYGNKNSQNPQANKFALVGTKQMGGKLQPPKST